MTRRAKTIWVIVGCTTVVIIIAAIIATQIFKSLEHKVNFTDEQVRQILKTDLPLGTAKSVVRHFLDAKGWHPFDDGTRTIAWIVDASHGGLVRTDIQIRFYFDSEGKLISYELEDFTKGP